MTALLTHWVYVHIDAQGDALYVGCTSNPDQRLENHRATAPWFSEIADVAQIGPFDKKTAFGIEIEFIDELQPPANVFHTARDPRLRPNWPDALSTARQIRGGTVTHYAHRFGQGRDVMSNCGLLRRTMDDWFQSDEPATCANCRRAAGIQSRPRA